MLQILQLLWMHENDRDIEACLWVWWTGAHSLLWSIHHPQHGPALRTKHARPRQGRRRTR